MSLKGCLVVLILCSVVTLATKPQRLPVGLILDQDEQELEVAFRASINRVNQDMSQFELVPIVQYLSSDESATAKRVVCDLVADGVIAIFGPHSRSTNGIVASICNDLQIPHLLYSWQDEEKDEEKIQRNMTLNVHPDSLLLSRAYAELVKDSDWNTFIVMYETREGLLKLQDSLQVHKPSSTLFVFPMGIEGSDYRPLLKRINATREINFLIDCSPLSMVRLLKQVQELKLLKDNQNYFFTNLDTHTVDFSQFGVIGANISYVQLYMSERLLRRAIYDWTQYEEDHGRELTVDQRTVTTTMVLMHDAVALLASVLKKWYTFEEIELPNIDCNYEEKWKFGAELVDRMKILTRNKTLEGDDDTYITGRMDLSKYGDRNQFRLDFTIRYGEASKSSSWTPDKGVVFFQEGPSNEKIISQAIQNKTFIVTTKLGEPFLMERKSPDGVVYEGNARYKGYSLDLIQKLSEALKFKYEIVLDPDGKNGEYRKDQKRWNGILGQLIDGNADIGIGDLTITAERRQVVDFTVPFMSLGISVLYAVPKQEPPNIFSFLSPFSSEVWVYTAVVYLVVSILLFMVARISYLDWESPHPCDDDPEEVENIWNLPNATWLTMGSIMTQGSDILPKGVPMRLVVGMWWFFALLLAASYTANLSAFLSKSRIDVTIKNVEDLAGQNKIKYGAMKGGSTAAFFRESNESLYHRMWVAMENEVPSVFTDSNQGGVDRVLTGKRKYAFLMESTMIEYVTQKYCDLTEVGQGFGDKFYGIALPLNSRYRSEISTEILRMSERGELYELKNKWWKNAENSEECAADTNASDDDSLTIDHVGGVFLVLGIGCVLAYIIGICEFLWHIQDVAVQEKITPWEALKAETLFVLKFWIRHKPIKIESSGKSSSSSTSSSSSSSSTSSSSRSKRSAKSKRSRSRFSETRSVNFDGIQPSIANYSMKSTARQ